MGNSEVGHLNLGAGAVGQAGPHAHRRGRRATGPWRRTTSCARRCRTPRACTSSASSPTAACTPAGAISRRSSRWRPRPPTTSSSTPSPTGATRCPTRAPASSSRCRSGARMRPTRPARAWAPSSGATGRWIATSAGSAPRRPTTCSCTAAPSTTPTAASRRCAPRTSAARRDEFIEPTTVGDEACIRPGDSVIALQLPPRPHARDHARAGRAGLRRGRSRRRGRRSSGTPR